MFGKLTKLYKKFSKSDELITVENVNYEGEEPIIEGEELISIHGVDLSYSGKNGTIKALENINFNIYRGEFICVLGPSGCGKSTLLKILAGFLRPTTGSVKLSGNEITGIDWQDALTREDMQNLTRNIWQDTGKTIFFITHDVEEALLLASRIIVLSKHPGRIIEDIPVDFSLQITEKTAMRLNLRRNFINIAKNFFGL